MSNPTIIYTITDEAPALATRSLLPIIDAFTDAAGVPVETRDISLAARMIAAFPENLGADHQATEYQCIHSATHHRHQRVTGARIRSAGLPGRAAK